MATTFVSFKYKNIALHSPSNSKPKQYGAIWDLVFEIETEDCNKIAYIHPIPRITDISFWIM